MTRRRLLEATLFGSAAWDLAADEKPMNATAYVGDFILSTRYPDIPLNVIDLAKKSILDGIGLALCGSVANSGTLVRKYLSSERLTRSGSDAAVVIGSSLRVPPRFAAFANGIGIHADDYDDTQLAVAADRVYGLLTHPTAPVLPAALAIAESRNMAGRDLLLSYNIGVEVETKIAEAINPRHYEDGFHSTGTAGVFGAAAAAAKLLGLDRERTLRALGIAGSEAAGLRENFGSMTKPFHAGRAAESGVVAAAMASLGWTATDQILEAPRGFFQAAGGGWDPNALMGKLGKPWTFLSPGVSIKPSPSGSLSLPGIGEMLRLVREFDIKPADVLSVDVGTNKNMPNALIHHQPKDSLQAKFSMEFCMAAALLYRKVGLSEFRDETVNRPDVQAMIARIHFGVNPVAEAAGYDKMATIIDLQMRDGRTISGRADFAKGSPANPMTWDEVAAKFMDCAAFARWPLAKSKAILAMVGRIETVANIRELTSVCTPRSPPRPVGAPALSEPSRKFLFPAK